MDKIVEQQELLQEKPPYLFIYLLSFIWIDPNGPVLPQHQTDTPRVQNRVVICYLPQST